MAGYSTPCQGELDFWRIMESGINRLARQAERIADALERQNHYNGLKVSDDFARRCLPKDGDAANV